MKWMLMPLRRYADFNGRSRRMEYWMWVMFSVLVGLAITVPLQVVTVNAFRAVEAQGGVSYGSSLGGIAPRTDGERPQETSPGDRLRSDDGQADDWSANPGPNTEDDGNNQSDDGPSERSDEVSSRAKPMRVDGGILAFSRSYEYSSLVNVDPAMFFRAFGPLGWTFFGLLALWTLFTLIPSLAVAIRRLHDTNRSGWWILIGMVPIIGFIVLLVFLLSEGTRGPNRFGADPKEADVDRTHG